MQNAVHGGGFLGFWIFCLPRGENFQFFLNYLTWRIILVLICSSGRLDFFFHQKCLFVEIVFRKLRMGVLCQGGGGVRRLPSYFNIQTLFFYPYSLRTRHRQNFTRSPSVLTKNANVKRRKEKIF